MRDKDYIPPVFKDRESLSNAGGCRACPFRDECPDAMTEVWDKCGMYN